MTQVVNNVQMITKIKGYILESTFSDPGDISSDTMIFKEGILDSMGLMNLITFLEEEFKILIKETDLEEENFESIDAMANFVSGRL